MQHGNHSRGVDQLIDTALPARPGRSRFAKILRRACCGGASPSCSRAIGVMAPRPVRWRAFGLTYVSHLPV